MTPYYDHGGITIYHGDCLDLNEEVLGQGYLLQTDPPYAVSTAGGSFTRNKGKGTRNYDFFAGDSDWKWTIQTVSERIIRAASGAQSVYVWCGHRQFGSLCDLFEMFEWKTRFIVWRKTVPIPAPPNSGWDSAAELCLYAYKSGRVWNGQCGQSAANVIDSDSYRFGQPGKVDHPTQKPIDVIARPMLLSSRVGDLVYDPYMGSGTTLVVAKRNGRRAIGVEIEERYCEIAAKRLAQECLF